MPVRQKQKRTQAVDKVNAHRRDSFQTPNYATELLIPFIPKNVEFVWECACGGFKISNVLVANGFKVYNSDLEYPTKQDNFLTCGFPFPVYKNNVAIITNPPFSLKKLFFDRCLWFEVPFALLIPTDYCGWIIDGLRLHDCEKIIPTRRIDYITPSGLNGGNGHTSNFHSMWLTKGFNLGKSETFIELTNEMKKNI